MKHGVHGSDHNPHRCEEGCSACPPRPSSHINGVRAGRKLNWLDAIVDLDEHNHKILRFAGEDIPAGALLEVRENGRVYRVPE